MLPPRRWNTLATSVLVIPKLAEQVGLGPEIILYTFLAGEGVHFYNDQYLLLKILRV